MSKPWAMIIELIEARSKRMERSKEDPQRPKYIDGEPVTYTDNLTELGLGRG